ncbi:MAG TPA: spore germination protein GerW family protein [Fibrobacteria bacterium]|nr:spore germination protein GerW family protein [Fibrobacteria bacterium]
MSVAETLDSVLDKVKGLVQAESVVGKPIQAPDGTIIVPVCRISVGFGGGGGTKTESEGVATGAGAVVTPVAFLVLRPDRTDLVPLDRESWQFGKIVDFIPDIIEKFRRKSPEKPPV